MNIARAAGLELAYDIFGEEDGEPLLLVSGLGAQMIRWTAPFCEALAARGFRVIRFDNRDCGRSTHLDHLPPPDFAAMRAALESGRRPHVPYTLLDMAGDAAALLDALSIPRAHVAGRSMGGMIAQIMASEMPGRVLSLTSIMSGTGDPTLPQAAPDVMAMLTRPAPDAAEDPEGHMTHGLAFARRIAGPGAAFDEAAHRDLIAAEARHSGGAGGTARQIAAMAAAGDRRERLAAITAPTLVVHGMQDPLIPAACGESTAAAIPGAELLLMDGMGHDLPPRFHAQVIDAIRRTADRAERREDGSERPAG